MLASCIRKLSPGLVLTGCLHGFKFRQSSLQHSHNVFDGLPGVHCVQR